MFNWIRYHIYELNIFVVGWCSFATFDCLMKEQYLLGAVNAGLVFFNIKMAQANK